MAGRLSTAAAAFVGLVLGATAINFGGKALIEKEPAPEFVADTTLDPEMEELARQAAEPDLVPDLAIEPETVVPEATAEGAAQPTAEPSQEPAAKPETETYERVTPRAPLSELGTAQPPKRKRQPMPEDWKSTRLFNPVASAAGIVEAQGYRLALAGVDPLPLEESCTYQGKSWPCGAQARTAFRAWLRARAIQCKVPPEPDRELITAECYVGKEDIAQWLVASGWARPSGAYVEDGKKAQTEKKGIYGAPPARINLMAVPTLSLVPDGAADQPDITPEPATGSVPTDPPAPSP